MKRNEHLLPEGLKKKFFAYEEAETNEVLIRTNHEYQIIDGQLKGAQIDLYDKETFRVWTHQTKLAKSLSLEHDIELHELTGEAELFVPIRLADDILPRFGAKVKRQLSEAHLAQMTARITDFQRKKRAGDGTKPGQDQENDPGHADA